MTQKRIFKFVIIAFLFYIFMNYPQISYAKTNSRELTIAEIWASKSEDQKKNFLYGYMIGSSSLCKTFFDEQGQKSCLETFSLIDVSTTIQLLDWCYIEKKAINVSIDVAIIIINNRDPVTAKRKLLEISNRDDE